MHANQLFATYLDDYFEAAEQLAGGGLRDAQEGLFASLGFGAAGIAFAHWYCGVALGSETLLARAERWSRAAVAGQRGALAFLDATAPKGAAIPSASLIFGPLGLYLVRALVAAARRDRRGRARALRRVEAIAREAAGEGEDDQITLYTGVAGCLVATGLLFNQLPEARLRWLGEDLAARLLRSASRERDGRAVWPGLEGPGLAHGTAGVYHALLLWSEAAGTSPPPWLSASLSRFFAELLAIPRRLSPREEFDSFLCNGFSGLAVVAAMACRVFGAEPFLEAARAAMRLALAHPPAQPELCCGRAGIAAGCLSLARVDATGPWLDHARDLTLSTLLCDPSDWVYTGLYSGEAAIPCLALDLRLGRRSGPPCLDLPDLPPHFALGAQAA